MARESVLMVKRVGCVHAYLFLVWVLPQQQPELVVHIRRNKMKMRRMGVLKPCLHHHHISCISVRCRCATGCANGSCNCKKKQEDCGAVCDCKGRHPSVSLVCSSYYDVID